MKALLILLLCCSGLAAPGWAVGATERICLQPSDRIAYQAPCDVQIQPIAETNPAESARKQAALGPNVMLWIGGKTQAVVDRFPALIQAAKQYPNIKSVYLIDEWGWDHATLSVRIGLYESEVLWGAAIAHAAGLKTVISIPPQVILHPDFRMRDINAFDVIGIDPYPANGPLATPGCGFDSNYLSTALYCSYVKLLSLGYRGRIGYLAQGFGVTGTPSAELKRQLTLQQETIRKAFAMNVDAFMGWGLFLGPDDTEGGAIYPLGGTSFEALVKP